MATIQSHTHEVRRAAANPGLKLLQRLGYVVRGVLYALRQSDGDIFRR